MISDRDYVIICDFNICKLTMRPTPQSGRNSTAAEINSFPYLAVKCLRTSMSSGMSAHLGDANITLATASFRSMGQFLEKYEIYQHNASSQNDLLT